MHLILYRILFLLKNDISKQLLADLFYLSFLTGVFPSVLKTHNLFWFFFKGNTSRFGSAIHRYYYYTLSGSDMENTLTHVLLGTVIVVVFCFFFNFYLYNIAMEKCSFLSIVISFVMNISLLTLLSYLQYPHEKINRCLTDIFKI